MNCPSEGKLQKKSVDAGLDGSLEVITMIFQIVITILCDLPKM
jgi:hypothetical protein